MRLLLLLILLIPFSYAFKSTTKLCRTACMIDHGPMTGGRVATSLDQGKNGFNDSADCTCVPPMFKVDGYIECKNYCYAKFNSYCVYHSYDRMCVENIPLNLH
jgi:hypothetical protein